MSEFFSLKFLVSDSYGIGGAEGYICTSISYSEASYVLQIFFSSVLQMGSH